MQIHYWPELQEAIKENPKDNDEKNQARGDLKDLMEQISESSEMKSYFKTRESYLQAKITTYETMWSLFVPRQKIYAKTFMSTPQIFVVESPPYNWDRGRSSPSTLEVDCWCYDWNGKEMVKTYYGIEIEKFQGTKRVNELAAYPLEYYDAPKDLYTNEEELCAMLVNRGCKYNKIVRGPKGASQMYQYDGDALADRRNIIQENSMDQNEQEEFDSNPVPQYAPQPNNRTLLSKRKTTKVKGKFIIDAQAFLNYGSGSLILGQIDPYLVEDKSNENIENQSKEAEKKTKDFSDKEKEFLLLLPPRFLGYSPQEKFWGQFKVDATEPVPNANASIFDDKLQLDKEYKDMIRALVASHTSRNNSPTDQAQVRDLVDNKGKGLVILLHGPPGVGKTVS